jgi:hypothetical protein
LYGDAQWIFIASGIVKGGNRGLPDYCASFML